MAQAAVKTSTKPAAKPAQAAKGKPATKGAKGATKPAQQPATKPAQQGAKYHVLDGFRPGSGRLLFAYTMAWLQESGLIDGGDIGRADAVKLAGGTAISYHTGKTRTMIEKEGRISLAPHGANFFADRGADSKHIEAYRGILRDGKPDGELIKPAHAIGKLGA